MLLSASILILFVGDNLICFTWLVLLQISTSSLRYTSLLLNVICTIYVMCFSLLFILYYSFKTINNAWQSIALSIFFSSSFSIEPLISVRWYRTIFSYSSAHLSCQHLFQLRCRRSVVVSFSPRGLSICDRTLKSTFLWTAKEIFFPTFLFCFCFCFFSTHDRIVSILYTFIFYTHRAPIHPPTHAYT